jgi:hypothetical protein
MLTRVAVGMYLDKLGPDGILALHITNRHLDLVGVTTAVAKSIPGIRAVIAQDKVASLDHAQSKVMFITRSEASLAALNQRIAVAAPPAAADDHVAWADDYSDILSALWRQSTP